MGSPRLDGRLDAVTATVGLPRLAPAVPSNGPGIGGRLRSLHRLDRLTDGLDEWGPPPVPDVALDELIGAAARVLAARSDSPIAFCHAVKAPAAVRLVLPVLPAELQRASVAASWQVVGGIVAAFASPREDGEAAFVAADAAPLIEGLPPGPAASSREALLLGALPGSQAAQPTPARSTPLPWK